MSNTRDQTEQKLEAMLRSRPIEPVSPDLAERIVCKAQHLPQNQTVPLTQWIRGLFTEFHLPRPVYVLVTTLIFGFVVGFTIPQYTNTTTTDDADLVLIQSFLYADEDLL